MKKNLLLFGALALFFHLTSCKKDIGKPAASTSTETGSKLKVNTLPAPAYNDLALIPRKPGENFDTYHGYFHGSSVYVVGPPVYDVSKYPTLVNGIPAYAQSMYADNGASIDFQNTGTDGNVFQVTQTQFAYTDRSAIQKDEESYFTAFNSWVQTDQSTAPPTIFTYVKPEYKSATGAGVSIYTGKIICVTSGVHFGLAEINYPLPASSPTPPATTTFLGGVLDPITGHMYHVWGFNGIVNRVPDALSIKGTYTPTSNRFIFNVNITIVKKDGTSFAFVGTTLDLS
ncbi:hypothetical protein [Mucilaginibacter sp. FT3.2]|uniref:hypothetical protein n=1 Tax=Mucilaginibacter sp. FT3.2 TaxID=2723090 RepID=UPI00160EE88B|nr:hypothetical protein [Mucilaginibacter sp. FT3.2]MBB6230827.1 hypothetical protein [Mucilaginibacter sp. FT3.2]